MAQHIIWCPWCAEETVHIPTYISSLPFMDMKYNCLSGMRGWKYIVTSGYIYLERNYQDPVGVKQAFLILLSKILDYANFWWFIVIYSLSTHYLMITQLQYKDILIYLKKYCAFLSFLPLTTPTTPTMDSLSCLSSRFSSPDSSGRELIFTISADDDADDDSMVKNRETKSLTPNFGRHSHHFPRSTWNKHMARDLDARPAWATTFLSAHNTCESIHKFIN